MHSNKLLGETNWVGEILNMDFKNNNTSEEHFELHYLDGCGQIFVLHLRSWARNMSVSVH